MDVLVMFVIRYEGTFVLYKQHIWSTCKEIGFATADYNFWAVGFEQRACPLPVLFASHLWRPALHHHVDLKQSFGRLQVFYIRKSAMCQLVFLHVELSITSVNLKSSYLFDDLSITTSMRTSSTIRLFCYILPDQQSFFSWSFSYRSDNKLSIQKGSTRQHFPYIKMTPFYSFYDLTWKISVTPQRLRLLL